MAEKLIMIDLNDERSKNIAEILGNKTCKKIIDYLSERKEASEKDIADALSIPINTAEYNLNKLIESGLVEKTKNFFWSVKGRKIEMYRLANKKIIISTSRLIKGILPAFLAVLLGSFGIKLLTDRRGVDTEVFRDSVESAPAVVSSASSAGNFVAKSSSQVVDTFSNLGSEAWAWFLLGGLFVILVFLLWNQFKKMKGGDL